MGTTTMTTVLAVMTIAMITMVMLAIQTGSNPSFFVVINPLIIKN
jgi:hypothetical protein